MAVDLDWVAQRLQDTDAEAIASCLGLDEDETISVEDRLRYAEESLLPLLFDDADVAFCLSPVAIDASDGTPAVMVMLIQGYSFSGVTTTWLGPFPSWTDYLASLKRDGWVTSVEEFTYLPTAEKLQRLQAWR